MGEQGDGQMSCQAAARLYFAGDGRALSVVYHAGLGVVSHLWSDAHRCGNHDI